MSDLRLSVPEAKSEVAGADVDDPARHREYGTRALRCSRSPPTVAPGQRRRHPSRQGTLGHAIIATTERYLHTLPDADETALHAQRDPQPRLLNAIGEPGRARRSLAFNSLGFRLRSASMYGMDGAKQNVPSCIAWSRTSTLHTHRFLQHHPIVVCSTIPIGFR
jgi:hypothetical protein